MLVRFDTPRPPLRDFVHDFWLYEGYSAPHAHERILPSGTFELVFNLREDELRIYDPLVPGQYRRHSGAVVSGPYASAFASDIAEEASIMGVHFRPGGAFPFLGYPAGEFGDRHVDLDALWGRRARELRERLAETRSPTRRFGLLHRYLTDHLVSPLKLHWAVPLVLERLNGSGVTPKVRDIARQAGLSRRHLIEVFRTEVGMTPKLYGRVQRFQQLVAIVARTTPPDWAALASEHGFSDQSHMIREFATFCGLTPADYVRRRARLVQQGLYLKRNHFPV